MQNVATTGAQSEEQFAALVDELAAHPARREQLTELLGEDHPFYDQRGTATTARMRGWVLLALARAEVSDDALLFLLEELDTGVEAYLVAAAARALRSYHAPHASFAPFVLRAINQIRYRDEPLSFESYGAYAISSTGTSPLRELLATLAWLGPHARAVLPEVEALGAQGGLSAKLLPDVQRAVEAIRGGGQAVTQDNGACCTLPAGLRHTFSWVLGSRRGSELVEQVVFEDQDGASLTFKELFHGHPSIVVFFYTRCDNPLKCSLTVTKLARVQKLLEARGLAGQIHTAAITYDPEFDLSERIRGYGRNRGVRLDPHHRMLRTTDGFDTLRRHFKLGVNFIESLVNRHRLEVYILDAEGRTAASFERIHWDEQQVLERAVEVLREQPDDETHAVSQKAATSPARRRTASTMFGTLASLGVAFFPKCPICWAGYMSFFGIASLQQIPYSPWLQSVLAVVMLINLTSVWLRGRATGRMSGFYLVSAGIVALVVSKLVPGWENVAVLGIALTLAGSLASALGARNERTPRPDYSTSR